MNRIIITLVTLSALYSISYARILNVPEDFQTIQAGIDASQDGDTVLVQPGVYWELLVVNHPIFLSSLILMTSNAAYIDSTVIDPAHQGCGIRLVEGSDGATVRGFTVRNGSQQYGGGIEVRAGNPRELIDMLITENVAGNWGGGIYVTSSSSLNISRCQIVDNQAGEFGGGIFYRTSNINCRITDSVIRDNRADQKGGGVYCYDTPIEMQRVLVLENYSDGQGGGFFGQDMRSLTLNRVTMVGNDSRWEGNALYAYSNTIITNSVFYSNPQPQIYLSVKNTALIRYSDIEGSNDSIQWVGRGVFENNIDTDPLFLDSDNGDYSLTADSPCIDAGDPDSPLDPDGTRADMGAFYYRQKDIEVYPPELAFGALPFGEIDSQLVIVANTGGTPLTFRITESQEGSSITIRQADGREIVVEPNSGSALWAFYRPAEGAVSNQTFTISSDDPDEPEITIEATEVLGVPSDILHSAFFTLHSAYPNPFNSSTTIRYSVGSQAAPTRLAVYGLDGRLVEDLWTGQTASVNPPRLTESTNAADRRGSAEEKAVVWNAEGLPGGIYLVRLESGSQVQTMKTVLLK